MVASMSRNLSQDAKIDTLRLFLSDIDFHKDANRSFDGWRALFINIDSSRGNDLTFDWLIRNCASEIIRNFNPEEFAETMYYALVECVMHSRAVLSMLSLEDEAIKRAFNNPMLTEVPIIHTSICYQRDTVALIRWGMNLYAPSYLIESLDKSSIWLMSPTSYAMLSSETFYYWRESLQLAEVNIKDFVKRECKVGTVTDEGWEEDTLLRLFQSNLPRIQLRHGLCSKCNGYYNMEWFHLFIEVSWCLELEKIKTGSVDYVGGTETSEANRGLQIEKQEGKGIHCPCVQDNDFVCCKCWGELRNPDHQHESEHKGHNCEESKDDEKSSPTAEELSDWEDSPFLPTINIF